MAEQGTHSAAGPALGYLYQTQWPLLELTRGREGDAITLELLDDVAWESDGTAKELLQVKHHQNAAGMLGDRDDDLWRTIRSWMDNHAPGDPNGPRLILITTETAAPDSAAAALRPRVQDFTTATRLLETAAQESEARSTRDVRGRFLDLSQEAREIFVRRMAVSDEAPGISDLDSEIREELRWVLPRDHEDNYMGRLWRWWYERALEALKRDRDSITVLELRTFTDDLRDEFTADNLPTLAFADELGDDDVANHQDRPFVHQMRWVNAPSVILEKAIVDYYRAYVQSVRWVDDDLIDTSALGSFEDALLDEWEREFAWMESSLPSGATEETKRKAGLELLRKALQESKVRVRQRYDEPFFFRGKLHELADRGELGWHVEFQERLETLLISKVA